jgi:hypothetical protein
MAKDDWRVRIELPETSRAEGLLARIGLDLGSEARELAKELKGRRLVVTRDEDELFVYASSQAEGEQAVAVVEALLREEGVTALVIVEQWLPDEDRWSTETPGPDVEEELLAHGYAPWEVRVDCESHEQARELADELEAEGYSVLRRFRYVIAGTASREDAEELAQRVSGEVEPGSELVWEVSPHNPFAIFGGLGGTGTPL